ncbi:hypothetical protein AOQ84DRAFT_365997 [Glonium stellatum]|uniref:Infection structure specific protein n=1 Tax=Glonium stellatum TaxID=574774 RepID=A0A8E2EXL4_9PEZI|nr:hypothetical protein AOQ84DRAFT_365997 [Glonium stellatum]
MHAKQFILFSLTAVVALAEPVANRMERRQYSSIDENSLLAAASSEIAAASSALAVYSDMPTLPASIESIIATAIPASIITNPAAECSALNGQVPDWYKTLPANVKSALTSYESALLSWDNAHSSLFATESDLASSLSELTGTGIATGLTGCGVTSAPSAAASVTGTTAKGTGAATATGAQATGTNAAARPTGAAAAGVAGVVGLLGLVAAL